MSGGVPGLQILPERPLADERLSVRVTGLGSGQRIEVVATTSDADGKRWRSSASFIAGRSGVVDLARQSPLWGDYRRADSMGLFWSMRCAQPLAAYADPIITPVTTSLDVRSGGATIVGARVDRAVVGPGVERTEVRDEGLVGSLFGPAAGRAPGVLVLAGAAGAAPERTAALLASHGFTALALAYARARHVPSALGELPLEYFERAMAWLLARRSVAGTALAVLGTAGGADVARLLGATFPTVGAVCAVGTAGADGGGAPAPAWSYRGRTVAPVDSLDVARSDGIATFAATAGSSPFAPPFLPSGREADAAAAESAWRRLLAFLAERGPSL